MCKCKHGNTLHLETQVSPLWAIVLFPRRADNYALAAESWTEKRLGAGEPNEQASVTGLLRGAGQTQPKKVRPGDFQLLARQLTSQAETGRNRLQV